MASTVTVVALVPYIYNSKRYEVGEILSIDESDHLQAAIAAKQVAKCDAPVSLDEGSLDGLAGEGLLEELGALWDFDATPEAYLEQFPEGPNADLAKRIVSVKSSLPGQK